MVRSATGTLPAELLAGRPVEERDRPEWTVTWAVPVDADGGRCRCRPGRSVHAPTPTDEPLSLPAVLLGGFPLGPDRRHVIPGPVTDLLAAAAGRAYAELVAELPPGPALLSLVPRPTLAAAELDATVGRSVLAALRDTAWLPTAGEPAGDPAGDARRTEPAAGRGGCGPGDAVVVDAASDRLVGVLADLLPGLLPASWSGRGRAAALTALGVRRLSTADVVELVSGVDRPPAWWRELYAALADVPDRETLTAVPVPLADGRMVTGVRGALLPDPDLPAAAAGALGLRVVHPDAAHPLLERLGALPATARGVLADERVRAAVEASYDEEDPAPVADAVLALVAGARPAPGELPWLAELALPADRRRLVPGRRAAAARLPAGGGGRPGRAVRAGRTGPCWTGGAPTCSPPSGVLRTFAVLRAAGRRAGPGRRRPRPGRRGRLDGGGAGPAPGAAAAAPAGRAGRGARPRPGPVGPVAGRAGPAGRAGRPADRDGRARGRRAGRGALVHHVVGEYTRTVGGRRPDGCARRTPPTWPACTTRGRTGRPARRWPAS